jgi:hypothetical protein
MHRIIKREIEEYLSGYPSAEFLSHLSECSACASRVAPFMSIAQSLRSLRQDEMLPAPAGFTKRLRDYIALRCEPAELLHSIKLLDKS